jgi:hypothetical protein
VNGSLPLPRRSKHPRLLADRPTDAVRRDRILHEALATGAGPLHLTLLFNIDHTNAMAYATAARNLLTGPAEQALWPGARDKQERAGRCEGPSHWRAAPVTANVRIW